MLTVARAVATALVARLTPLNAPSGWPWPADSSIGAQLGVLLRPLFGLPIAPTFAVSFTVRRFLSERYLTVCTLPLYTMLAVVLTRAQGRLACATVVGAAIAARLQLFNPTQRETLAQVDVSHASRPERHSVPLPAGSVVDLVLSQWGVDAPSAALRIYSFALIVPLRSLATPRQFRIAYGMSGLDGRAVLPALGLTLPTGPARAGITTTLEIPAAPDSLVHVALPLPDGRSTSLYDLMDGQGRVRLGVRLPSDSAPGSRATTARIVVQAAGTELTRTLPILPPDSRARSNSK